MNYEEVTKRIPNKAEKDSDKLQIHGELALLLIVVINSLGVVLMLYSGSGISAISSVPYAFSEVFTFLSLGTWTYMFQGLLVLSLMILQRIIIPSYLFSFVVGFAFGKFVDLHELWISTLPSSLPLKIFYFCISYFILAFGIALSNRCKMPIVPTDLFPRELSAYTKIPYSKVKISFDVICLCTTALMTFFCLGHIKGLGIGTVIAALTYGKTISFIGRKIDEHVVFITFQKNNSF